MALALQRAVREFGSTSQRFYDIVVKILVGFIVAYFIVLTAALGPALYRFLTDSTSKESSAGDKSLIRDRHTTSPAELEKSLAFRPQGGLRGTPVDDLHRRR